MPTPDSHQNVTKPISLTTECFTLDFKLVQWQSC
jgi:hypothetical protein